jgi:hypothetical protein
MTARRTVPVLLAGAALAGCGSARTPDTVAEGENGPLLELTLERQNGEVATGLRVQPDGALELLSTDGWQTKWRYDEAELQQLRRAIADADRPPLEAHYSRAEAPSHPMTARWRLRGENGVKSVTVAAYEPGIVPPLDKLYRRVFELHREPPSDSIWRVRVGDETIERVVGCEPASVPALRPLVHALFVGKSGQRRPLANDSTEPLVEIVWRTNGDETERTLVYEDGRNVSVRGKQEREEPPYTPAELNAIRAALQRIDWRSLPNPVC